MKHIGTVSKMQPKAADAFQDALCKTNETLVSLLGGSTLKDVFTDKCTPGGTTGGTTTT